MLVLLSPSILGLTGVADENVQRLSQSYIFPILFSAILFLGAYTLNGILNAYGDTKTYSKTLFVGAFANFALDPLLMYGFGGWDGLGIAGVAWATIIIEFFTLAYMLRVLLKRGILHGIVWR